MHLKTPENVRKHLKTIRIHKDNRYTVGYFFKNDLGLTEDVKLDDSIMEIRFPVIFLCVPSRESPKSEIRMCISLVKYEL